MSLFIANFPSQTPDQEIKNIFLPYGIIHFSRQNTYGFIQLQSIEFAEKALSNLQGRLIRGCPLRLEWNYKETTSTQRIPFNTMEVEEENKEASDSKYDLMLEEDEIAEWMDYINLALSFFERLTSLHNLTDLVTRTNISTTEKFIEFTSKNKMLTFEDFGEELEDIVGKHELSRYMELDRIVNKLLFLVEKCPSQDYLMSRNPKSVVDIIQIIFRNMVTWTRQALCITVTNKCGMQWSDFFELYRKDDDALAYSNYVTIGRALSSGFRQNIIKELNHAIRTLDTDIATFIYTILRLTFNYQDEVGHWWNVLRDKNWEIVNMQADEDQKGLKSEIINDALYLSHKLLSCKDHRILKFYEVLGLDLRNEVQDSDQVLKDLKDLWPKRCPLRREKCADWIITTINEGLLLESELLLNYLHKARNIVRTMLIILHELVHEKKRIHIVKNNYLFETSPLATGAYRTTHNFRAPVRPEQIDDTLAYEILSFDQSEEKWNRLLSALNDLTQNTSKRKRVIRRTNTTVYRGCGTQMIIECEKESGKIWKRCLRF